MSRTPMPEHGISHEAVLRILREARSHDMDLTKARINVLVPYPTDDVFDMGADALRMFSRENAYFAKLMPSVGKVQQELLDYALFLQNAPEQAGAAITSGGTESVFSACLAAREHFFAKNGSIGTPQILAPRTIHPAFHKAAHILRMKVVCSDFDSDFRAVPSSIAQSITKNTAMIAGSAPQYPHGVFDPIAELSELAAKHDIWFHVDACVGGYLSPFAERLGRPIPVHDFRLPGVWSMSADLHKHGYAPKGISTILYRDAELLKYQSFESSVWPFRTYRSGGFRGSYPAAPIAGAWAILTHLGVDGFMRQAAELMRARDRLMAGVTAIDGMQIFGNPQSSIFAFGSDVFDIFAVADRLETRCWISFKLQEPRGLQMQCDPFADEIVDAFLADLRASVGEVVNQKG